MHQRVNIAACGMTAAVPTSQIKISDWSGLQPAIKDVYLVTSGRQPSSAYIFYLFNLGEINSIVYIYHLFTETEGNSVFCWPETAVEGPQNTLLS